MTAVTISVVTLSVTILGSVLFRGFLAIIPILIGVNLLTFVLFFVVNSPDDMARMQIGVKRATPEAIERWKVERGYDKPMFVNADLIAAGLSPFDPDVAAIQAGRLMLEQSAAG